MRLSQQLEGVHTVAIGGHIRPDGDCVGSALAVYNYIKRYHSQIEVDVYLEPIPHIFEFLENSDQILHTPKEGLCYDLFLVVDCGAADRLGRFWPLYDQAKKTICIDHHISNEAFAMVNHIDPKISSASELIFHILEEDRIDRAIAECLYVGIIHDTGMFAYASTTKQTMEVAGKLMERGIDFARIVRDTFYTKTQEQNRILGMALAGSWLELENRCVVSCVTEKQMQECHAKVKHLNGIVEQLLYTKGVETAVFFYGSEEGYRVSLRSKSQIDVAKIAVSFGGGGHIRAAGATLKSTPEECLPQILDAIRQQYTAELRRKKG